MTERTVTLSFENLCALSMALRERVEELNKILKEERYKDNVYYLSELSQAKSAFKAVFGEDVCEWHIND